MLASEHMATGPDAATTALGAGSGFPTTHWSRVLCAGRDEAPAGAAALEALCRAYWPPLYAFVRRNGHTPADAQDLVQGFLAHLLARHDLATVAPQKGRFRSFLLTALKHFLVSKARSRNALKRGGGQRTISLDTEAAESICASELVETFTPDRAFDRRWARMVMARALDRLRAEHRTPLQARLFAALQPVLMEGSRVRDEAGLAVQLGVTPGALALAATRLRQRYRALIEDEVLQTLATPADLAAEMQALLEAWR